jgi:AcrR family transcriptional regulator
VTTSHVSITACNVIVYDQAVTRWEGDTPGRLQRAAFELFAERGFAHTTVPQIAARAGLTTRSFFRHYSDKREVLFRGDDEIPARVAALIASRPPGLSLLDLIVWGVQTIARDVLGDQRDYLSARHAIIATDAGLRERELHKQAAMATAISRALQDQGLDAITAALAGKLTTAISSTAVDRWLEAADERHLTDHVADVNQALQQLNSNAPWIAND